MGSYWVRIFVEFNRNRRICGSVRVAHRANKYSAKNIPTAPAKLFNKLNTHAPKTSAKKNSFRSAPRIVSGRFNDRKTGLMCIVVASGVLNPEQPREEVHCQHRHSETENDACEGFLASAFAEGKRQAAHNDGDESKPLGNRPGECRLQDIHGVLPRGTALRANRDRERETDGQHDDEPSVRFKPSLALHEVRFHSLSPHKKSPRTIGRRAPG